MHLEAGLHARHAVPLPRAVDRAAVLQPQSMHAIPQGRGLHTKIKHPSPWCHPPGAPGRGGSAAPCAKGRAPPEACGSAPESLQVAQHVGQHVGQPIRGTASGC